MTNSLQITVDDDMIADINDAAETLGVSTNETARRLLIAGLDDVDQLGDEFLIVTEE